MNIKRHSYPVLSCYHLGNSRGLSLELCARNEEDHMCISYCKSQCHIFLEMKMVQRGCTLQTVSRKTISTAYLRCVQMHTFAHIQLTLDFASLQVSDNLMGKKCFFSCIFSNQWGIFKKNLSVQLSRSVMSDSLRPCGQQHARLPCLSPTPGAYSNSCPLGQ